MATSLVLGLQREVLERVRAGVGGAVLEAGFYVEVWTAGYARSKLQLATWVRDSPCVLEVLVAADVDNCLVVGGMEKLIQRLALLKMLSLCFGKGPSNR